MSKTGDVEKSGPFKTEDVDLEPIKTIEDLDQLGEREGYILDPEVYNQEHHARPLKTAGDGKTLLIPQPSVDPNDPLNWSQRKKNLVLFVVSCTALLPDYGSATGAVTLIPQSMIWNMSEVTVNHSQVGNVFMLGAGGVFVTILGAYFGRLPTLFWFLVMALWTAAWCAGASTFEEFMAARILNGFFSTVAQGGGMMFIKDLFFFHEHARKINVWSAFIILSPYLGPLFTAFIINTQKWQWAFGVYTVMTGLCLIMAVLFVDETFYDRHIPMDEQPQRKSRLMRLIGVEQFRSRHQRNTLGQAILRPVKVIIKPTVFISAIYYCLTFAWVVGINTTLAIFVTPLYNFGPKQIGFFYFTPVVAALIGEAVGHWFHDAVAKWSMRRNKGHLEPEARLNVLWFSTPFMVAGLILLGFCLEQGYHYMVTAVAWGLYVFGIMITTVAINAYNLDSYPEGSGEVTAWINFARTTGGFIVSYFQVQWADSLGPEVSFGTQAAIVAAMFLLILTLQIWGKRMRKWAGPLDFRTN